MQSEAFATLVISIPDIWGDETDRLSKTCPSSLMSLSRLCPRWQLQPHRGKLLEPRGMEGAFQGPECSGYDLGFGNYQDLANHSSAPPSLLSAPRNRTCLM